MRGLLLPGIKLKRWLLLLALGILGIISFIILTFSTELAYFFNLLNHQLTQLAQLPVHSYSPKLIAEILIFIVSLALLILGGRGFISYLIDALIPEKKGKIWSLLQKHSIRETAPKIVVIGGGTGLNSILSGLKKYTNNLTAVVSVTDEGGSSRKLRYEFGMLPPGDIRNCIVALSESGPEMARLLEYRFDKGALKGHSFGNLLITALTKTTGSFAEAVEETGKILAIRGKVLPVTLKQTTLCAELENGKIIEQEPKVEEHKTKYNSEIKRLFIKPKDAAAYPEALNEIRNADLVVLGPGSLYTSILPNLLVKGVPEAIRNSNATKVYVCNVMTQPGETDNYTASDHVSRIVKHLGKDVLDHVVVNKERAPEKLYTRYRKEGASRVKIDRENLDKLEVDVVEAELLTKKNLLRHDTDKLARAVIDLT
ncbi:uridine diphosphate-N-acetylglucosamine-binding protein YvcK [Candidatus Woesearchaeota archaeon]|nr:uridine diphosphate-N-acetylglucosamine-binding protein YvcK [Candidatus Woesearchaeota archaeon]